MCCFVNREQIYSAQLNQQLNFLMLVSSSLKHLHWYPLLKPKVTGGQTEKTAEHLPEQILFTKRNQGLFRTWRHSFPLFQYQQILLVYLEGSLFQLTAVRLIGGAKQSWIWAPWRSQSRFGWLSGTEQQAVSGCSNGLQHKTVSSLFLPASRSGFCSPG